MGVWQPHSEYFKISTRQFMYLKSQYIFKVHCGNPMPKTILCVQHVQGLILLKSNTLSSKNNYGLHSLKLITIEQESKVMVSLYLQFIFFKQPLKGLLSIFSLLHIEFKYNSLKFSFFFFIGKISFIRGFFRHIQRTFF